MTNEHAALVLAAFWLISGRGLNLCLVIVLYYFTYIVLRSLTIYDPSVYYGAQMALDSLIIACCCQVPNTYRFSTVAALAYALVVFTSLLCEGLKLIDEVGRFYLFNVVHQWRQSISMPIDFLFAFVGSAWGGRLLDSYGLCDRTSSDYTGHKSTDKRF